MKMHAMKILSAAALAFLLACVPAFAQQTAIHSVPIGKGAGNTGFNQAVPSTAGQPLVSQGPTVDPAFGTIANSGFTPGPANTAKGSLNGTTTVDLPLPNCTGVNQAWKYVSGTGINCSAVSTTGGYDMPINLGLSALASGNALTITLTQANGAAPSASSPVIAPFRSTVGTTGTITFASVTATQSITIPNGATLGTSNGVPFRVWIFLEYNGGTPELAVTTCSNITTIFPCAAFEHTLPTTTTIGGSSNTGGTLYATTGVAADAVRIIGFCSFGSGLATAGAWSSSCTSLQVFGPGVAKPGDVVQVQTGTTSSATGCSSNSLTSLTATISPTSAINLVRVDADWNINSGTTGTITANLKIGRAGTPTFFGTESPFTFALSSGTLNMNVGGRMQGTDTPNTTSPVTYSVYCSGGGNFNASGFPTTINVQEIMG